MAVSDPAPDLRRLTLGKPGAKLVFVAFLREMVKPAKPLTTEDTEVHRGRRAFNNPPFRAASLCE